MTIIFIDAFNRYDSDQIVWLASIVAVILLAQ